MSKLYRQGQIVYVDLDPTKGVEMNKKRPCLVVSSHYYNEALTTLIVIPISSQGKYASGWYKASGLYPEVVGTTKIKGYINLPQLRVIDPAFRIHSEPVDRISEDQLLLVLQRVKEFFERA